MNNENQNWVVLKFGGTSVSTQENWQHILRVIKERKKQGFSVCIVHSALKGISNLLEELVEVTSQEEADAILNKIKTQHNQLAESLGVDGPALLKTPYQELEHLSKGIVLIGEASYRVQARMLAQGELMSTRLGAAYLNKEGIDTHWQDAREVLESTPQKNAAEKTGILNAVCTIEEDEALQKKLGSARKVILTQGFIAHDDRGETVLLGRGGSDVSAAYMAAKLAAKRLEIWTDVPGLFSANPQQISSARLLKELSYEEAQEIATNGAKVLHPRCILPARKHDIPIHVRCTHRPTLEGTVISNAASDEEGLVKTIALREDVILVSMESLGMWQEVGFLAHVFEVFKLYGFSIDLISTSESNVTVSLDHSVNSHFTAVQATFLDDLEQYCSARVIKSVSAVSLLGRHIRTILHRLGGAFEVFQEHKIHLVSQAANDLNFTFVVDSDQAERLVQQLHGQVISQSKGWKALGATWAELMEPKPVETEERRPWWQEKRETLLQLAQEKGSIYVYDCEELQRNVEKICRLKAVDFCYYAMKANAHAEVLTQFYEAGLGFECVSIGEIERVLELFPDIDRSRILFTPNFAPKREYIRGFEYGVNLTLDNLFPLQQWPEVFEEQELFLRIDPGHGQGHHKYVKTGGALSKFGIPRFEIETVKSHIEELNISVKGLQAHVGSGIKDPFQWKHTALILHEVAEQFGGVEVLDLGGGFGIRENEAQSSLDLTKVNESLIEFKETYPHYKLRIEPGRFLTATAGVLLSPVTQLKGKGKMRYVGVETGMNSLIRPALYGSSHTIVNLTQLNQPATQTVNIVGPICESGDKLGIDRRFPDSQEGDVVLVANTGAYGYVMSSNYNLRPPAKEVVI